MANDLNLLTVEKITELLKTQKALDDRIPTKNIQDSVLAYLVEIFEWVNSVEQFKNWKERPGKGRDVELDELADVLAFGLSIVLQEANDNNDEIADSMAASIDGLGEDLIAASQFNDSYSTISNVSYLMSRIRHDGTIDIITAIGYALMPFGIASNYYSVQELLDAYETKMKRNHARQDGTADEGKGYV